MGKKDGNKSTFYGIDAVWGVISLGMVIMAVSIAVRCNPMNSIFYGFVAFLFSEIYLLQFAIRKYILHTPGYCGGMVMPEAAVAAVQALPPAALG